MRCPFRMKGFDQPDTCDPECAWRMTYEPAPGGPDISPTSSCAVAILAQEANGSYGVRFEGEDNDEVGANDVITAGEFDALDEHAQTLERENAELQAKAGELTAELAAARSAHAQAEHDAETYREKLGRVLDMVQEMERVGTLVDQEGNVIG